MKPLLWMRAVRDAGPSATRLAVLFCLALRMDKDGCGYASQRQLAADADVDERTVRRHLDWARKVGLLTQTRRGHRLGSGGAVASEWQLSQPDTGDLLNQSQPDTGDLLNPVSTGQLTHLNRTADTPQPDTGVRPRGPLQEVKSSSVAPDGADDDDDAPGGASTMDGLGPAEQDVARRLPDNWSVATAIAVTAEIRQRFNPRNLAAYVARLSTEDLSRIVRDIEECAVCGLRGVNDNGLCPEHAGAAWSTGNGHSTTCPRCGRPWPRGADVPDDRICTDCRTSPARAAVEKIATILGDDVELHVDDEHDLEYGLTRAGVYLVVGGSTQEDPTLVAVWAEHNEDGGAWPEDKPLPDEPFRDLAVKNRPSEGRFYRPDDAIALAEHWHQATQVGATP